MACTMTSHTGKHCQQHQSKHSIVALTMHCFYSILYLLTAYTITWAILRGLRTFWHTAGHTICINMKLFLIAVLAAFSCASPIVQPESMQDVYVESGQCEVTRV